MKLAAKTILVLSLIATVLTMIAAIVATAGGLAWAGKMFLTASTLAGLAAALQLNVAGFFESVFKTYSDSKKFPFGPPSRINRELTDVPDSVIYNRIRGTIFYDTRTGFWLAMLSLLLSLPGTWLSA